MAYGPLEASQEDGSPIELYDIVQGDDSWHFTSSEETITIDAVEYLPIPLSRENIPMSSDERTEDLMISLPTTHEFCQRFIRLLPAETASITIRRFQRYDDDIEVIKLFRGTMSAAKYSNNGTTCQIGIAPYSENLSKPIPRYVYSGLCGNILGDRWCTVDLETGVSPDMLPYKFEGEMLTQVSTVITIDGLGSAYPDNFFQAGRILTPAGDTRLITKQIGDTIYLYIPLYEGAVLIGETMTLFAGCDHSLIVCGDKFDNVLNYNGFPFVPQKNPFQSGLK